MEQKDTSQISAFDTLFSNNHIQMLKVLLPYMDNQFQKYLAIYIKFQELQVALNFVRKRPYPLCGCMIRPDDTDPAQVVKRLLPLCTKEEKEQLNQIRQKVDGIVANLKKLGISVKFDDADNRKPGWKFANYELKGVPVRLAMGGLDLENNTIEVMRRDTLEKETVSCDGIETYVQNLLEEIQNNIYQKALNYRNSHIVKVDSYDEFKEQIEKGGFILAHWDGTPETEDRIKEETKATIRCLPFDADEESLTPGKCMVTGKPSARRVLFARAY